MHPKFSIIIPVYNVAPYLRRTLDSVVSQTVNDWECLCIDDGSSDGSGEILDEYAARDARFRVIHQKNSGVSAARNAALEVATGEWIGFLDGDDLYNGETLEMVANAIDDSDDIDVVNFAMAYVNPDLSRIRRFGGEELLPRETRFCSDVLGDGRRSYWRFVWSVCDKFFRRSRLEELKHRFVPGIKYGEDTLFTQSFLAQAKKIALLPDFDGYLYVVRSASAMDKRRTDVEADMFRDKRILYELYRKIGGESLRLRMRYNLVSSVLIGKAEGPECRAKFIDAMLDNPDFNGWMIRFLALHGTPKCKLVATVYILLPRFLRRKLLALI